MLIPQLLFGVFVLAGMLGIVYGVGVVVQACASARWSVANGTIVKSTIDIDDGDGERNSTYRPLIEYRFPFHGHEMTGSLIAFGLKNFYFSEKAARAYCKRYSVGTPVKVYHHPSDATRTVLEPGLSSRSFLPFSLSLCFLSIGLLMLWGSWH
jgi:hypothetical protein